MNFCRVLLLLLFCTFFVSVRPQLHFESRKKTDEPSSKVSGSFSASEFFGADGGMYQTNDNDVRMKKTG